MKEIGKIILTIILIFSAFYIAVDFFSVERKVSAQTAKPTKLEVQTPSYEVLEAFKLISGGTSVSILIESYSKDIPENKLEAGLRNIAQKEGYVINNSSIDLYCSKSGATLCILIK
jgi:hypothetical protein